MSTTESAIGIKGSEGHADITSKEVENVALRRISSARGFLSHRKTSFEDIRRAFSHCTDGLEYLLLTSSPTHGLATEASDVDMVGIAERRDEGARMATQLFREGRAHELSTFSMQELQDSLELIDRIASMPVAGSLEALASFEQKSKISKKYIERIINGVDATWTTPFSKHLPSLAIGWRRKSLENCIHAASLMALSDKAGERRGRVAYAINSVLHAMDFALSATLDVFSNKKWFLERFFKHEKMMRSIHPAPMMDGIVSAYGLISQVSSGDGPQLIKAVHQMVETLRGFYPTEYADFQIVASPSAQSLPFLPGGSISISDKSFFFSTDQLSEGIDGESICQLDPNAASVLLRALRGRIARIIRTPTSPASITQEMRES